MFKRHSSFFDGNFILFLPVELRFDAAEQLISLTHKWLPLGYRSHVECVAREALAISISPY
jgi:hypothetical protein